MESNNQKYFKTAATIVVTAIIQAVVFCLMIGLPLPQFMSSRDAESLQFQQLPEQKRTQPVEALENPAPTPAPTPAPEPVAQKEKPKKAVKKHVSEPIANATPQPEPVQQTQPADHTKVLVVNFEKPKDEKKEETSQKSSEEKPKLVPASDKLAGVQADDSKTEATADVSESPTNGASDAAMESMESTPAK